MKFGPVAIEDSLGGIVAHAVRGSTILLKKGEVVTASAIATLRAAGVSDIVVAQLEPDDIGEDAAALALAQAVAGENIHVERPFTGRANLFATQAGVLVLDAAQVDAVNAIDERITLATLPAMRVVVEGEMVATVKIIPFAVPKMALADATAAALRGCLRVASFRPWRVGVLSTLLPGLKPSVIAKTLRVLADRLAPMGASIAAQAQVPHAVDALAQAITAMAGGCDLIVIFGASAITDRRDVIPAAVELSGGQIDHFGMPVDPGNLLLLAHLPSKLVVLGAPGCARSPRENGFDFVLQRLIAGVPVTGADIRRMGAGGLLMEIISRPQPREGETMRASDE